MQDISRVRFDALASYCRQPFALVQAEEVRWLQVASETVLVVVIRDRTDGDYSAMLLARDLKERYRWVEMTDFFPTEAEAIGATSSRVAKVLQNLEQERKQGDEKGAPVDFFSHVAPPEKLNPAFDSLSTLEGFSPALEIMRPMMRWHEDADGNFVEQFQTAGFDARMWELYLFAMLIEAGYAIDRKVPVPDFSARGVLGELCIEATTVNPTRDSTGALVPPPPLDTFEQVKAFQTEYMPIRFAGPLTAKLGKRYWERPNVQGKPLVFAIQDFHAPMSMTISRAGLHVYLYGVIHEPSRDDHGRLVITPRPVNEHRWGQKVVQSGFFNLPGAENVSAVIANPSATISKFNRMGVIAGFGSKRVQLIREGIVADPDPNAAVPKTFIHEVNQDYRETWIEGVDVYHNPRATTPIHPMMLPGAAHHRLLPDGQVETIAPAWQPMSSRTLITLRE